MICIALISFFLISPVFAGDNNRVFTNQDLKKYKKSSDTTSSLYSDSIDITTEFRDRNIKAKDEEQNVKSFVIPYKAYQGTARRIIIPVTFNGLVTAPMLLDTGAPGMHISYRLAEKLDIFDNDEAKLWVNIAGIGGSIPAIFTVIDTIQVGEAEDHFIPTTVTRSISGSFEGLIGMDFMANYSIHIDTKKHVLVFEERPQRSDIPGGHDEAWWRITFRNFKSMRSAWEKYRKYLGKQSDDTDKIRRLKLFAERQYEESEELYNRLSVYASEHAVPLEWR